MAQGHKAEKQPLHKIWFNLRRYVDEGGFDRETACEMMRGSVLEEVENLVTVYEPENFPHILRRIREEMGAAYNEAGFTDTEVRRMVAQAHAKQCRARAENASPGIGPIHADFEDGGIFDEAGLESNLRSMEKTVAAWGDRPPIRFGISLLDDAFGGLLPGEIVTVVGAPGAMKTSLAIGAIDDFVLRGGGLALFVSVDMPKEEISLRFVLRECFDQYSDLELKALAARDDPVYLRAKDAMLEKFRGHLAITGHRPRRRMGLDQMLEEAAIRMPDFLVIDFLTALKAVGEDDLKLVERAMPRIQEFSQECQIPVLLLSQMGRASRSEQAAGKVGGHAKGGGIVEELSTAEIELLREPSSEGRKPEIVATITKTRRGIAGQSFFLDYVGKSMRFTGRADRAQRMTQRKSVFERTHDGYGG